MHADICVRNRFCSLPGLIPSEELTGRKQMCNLQPINFSFPLVLSLSVELYSLSLSDTHEYPRTPTMHCQWAALRSAAFLSSPRYRTLLSRSQKINMPLWISLTSPLLLLLPSCLLRTSRKKISIIYMTKQRAISFDLNPLAACCTLQLPTSWQSAFSCCDFSLLEKITRRKNLWFPGKRKKIKGRG